MNKVPPQTSRLILEELEKAWNLKSTDSLEAKYLPRIQDLYILTKALIESKGKWREVFLQRLNLDVDSGHAFEIYLGNILMQMGLDPVFWSVEWRTPDPQAKHKETRKSREETDILASDGKNLTILDLKLQKEMKPTPASENWQTREFYKQIKKCVAQKNRGTNAIHALIMVRPRTLFTRQKLSILEKEKLLYLHRAHLPLFISRLAELLGQSLPEGLQKCENLFVRDHKLTGVHRIFYLFRFKEPSSDYRKPKSSSSTPQKWRGLSGKVVRYNPESGWGVLSSPDNINLSFFKRSHEMPKLTTGIQVRFNIKMDQWGLRAKIVKPTSPLS
jgi:cold shock CspA family protein